MIMQRTYSAKESDIKRSWYIVDAKDKILGRLATRVASVLIGKRKAIYTPNIDCGDHVIVINAGAIRVTGRKLKDKVYSHYSGYPGGQKRYTLETLLKKSPEKVLELAIKRMLPQSPLGRKMFLKLKVYAGDKHPHKSQNPTSLEA
jgi:large subunit ribosomal protein L13